LPFLKKIEIYNPILLESGQAKNRSPIRAFGDDLQGAFLLNNRVSFVSRFFDQDKNYDNDN
jgi:hypothetical protein